MNNDLISRSALIENLNKMLGVEYDDQKPFERGFRKGLAVGKRAVELYPAAEGAVPHDEYDSLLRRFRHLLESDYIRSFDEYDPRTHTYKRDISEAVEPTRRGEWITIGAKRRCGGIFKCTACECVYPYKCKFCPNCGAKMDVKPQK